MIDKHRDIRSSLNLTPREDMPAYKREDIKYQSVLMPVIGITLAVLVLLVLSLHITGIMGFSISFMTLQMIEYLMIGWTTIMIGCMAVLIFSKKYGFASDI